MTEQLSILIGDDHELVRDAVAHMLRSELGFSVDVAKDGPSVLTAIAAAGGYSVVLLDVNMPGMHGLTSVEEVIRANKSGAVAIFSGQVDKDFVWKAIDMGAKGYIPKTLPIRALASTVRLIASGEGFVPMMKRQEVTPDQPGYNLTERELAILRKLPKGLTNKEIALIEGLSEVTVKMHMRAICSKLNAKNRTHAAMIAQQMSIS